MNAKPNPLFIKAFNTQDEPSHAEFINLTQHITFHLQIFLTQHLMGPNGFSKRVTKMRCIDNIKTGFLQSGKTRRLGIYFVQRNESFHIGASQPLPNIVTYGQYNGGWAVQWRDTSSTVMDVQYGGVIP